jgi:hypothetical protein
MDKAGTAGIDYSLARVGDLFIPSEGIQTRRTHDGTVKQFQDQHHHKATDLNDVLATK